MRQFLDHPLTKYVIIGSFSLAAAYLLWRIGGSIAEIVSDEPRVGVTIKLGGAIAGFAALFWLSLNAFERLHRLSPPPLAPRRLKIFLVPRDLFVKEDDYACEVSVYDEDSGSDRTLSLRPRRENGHLTIYLRDLRDTELFRIEMRASGNRLWRSEYCHPAAPRAEMSQT